MEISLCMIVRDEESTLARCLESVKEAVDEIIILDTGSIDATKEVARRFTSHVFEYSWKEDFSHARNEAFSRASKPYLMWLDADDVMEKDAVRKLIDLKSALNGRIDAVMMPYICGMRQDGTPLLFYDRERIVRADAGFFFEGAVHEAMRVSGVIVREDIAVHHMGIHSEKSNRRNLSIYEKWIQSERPMAARDWYYYAKELMTAGEIEQAEQTFARAIQMDCWKENRIDAHVQRAECLRRLGRTTEARAELYSAIAVDAPRSNALCALGFLEMEQGRNAAAVFWYRAARECEEEIGTGAFIHADSRDYIPAMQLCVLLDRMGRIQEAAQENERALIARPCDEAAMHNRLYFQEKLGSKKEMNRVQDVSGGLWRGE